jgi:hypothetical protein
MNLKNIVLFRAFHPFKNNGFEAKNVFFYCFFLNNFLKISSHFLCVHTTLTSFAIV